MRFHVITLFPELMSAVTANGVTGRAHQRGLWHCECYNPRDYVHDVHKSVDDRPYGGGPGMVMRYQPLADAVDAIVAKEGVKPHLIYLSPQGQPLTQQRVAQLAQVPQVALLCGRYEGVDERFIHKHVDEEISIGDFVVSGGELPAMMLMDAVVRLLPGVLGHAESAVEDSFTDGLLDCPHYTRPEVVAGMAVPAVLQSGNHAQIARWRLKQRLLRTLERRPDLMQKHRLTHEQAKLMAELSSDLQTKQVR